MWPLRSCGRAAVKALQLDPQLGEAHAAMGLVYAFERDWVNAEKEFQQSIRLDPSRTQTFTSYSISTLLPLQKYDEALRLLNTALQHDPLSLNVQREIGIVQMFSGRYAEAIETFQRVREVDPDFAFVQTYLARALILAGRVEEALPLWQSGSDLADPCLCPDGQTRRGRKARGRARALSIPHGDYRDRHGRHAPRHRSAGADDGQRAAPRADACWSSPSWRRFVIIRESLRSAGNSTCPRSLRGRNATSDGCDRSASRACREKRRRHPVRVSRGRTNARCGRVRPFRSDVSASG